MDGQENWEKDDIAEQIRKALCTAFEMKDFNQLNQAIGSTVDSALEEARQQFERYRARAGRDSEEPVDSQSARWAEDETAGSGARWAGDETAGSAARGGAAGASRTENDWRHGTRKPGDTGRYTYGDGGFFGGAANGMYGSGSYAENAGQQGRGGGGPSASAGPAAQGSAGAALRSMDFRVNWKGRISGIFMSLAGGIGASVFGLLTLLFFCCSLLVIDSAFGWGMTLFLALVTVGFGTMLGLGVARSERVHRLKAYLAEVRRIGRPYCETGRLGQAVGRGADFVKKDLQKILSAGMLPDARLAEDGSYLLMDMQTYEQYRAAQESYEERKEEEETRREKEEARREKEDAARASGKAETEKRRGEGGADGQSVDAAVGAAILHGEEQMELLDQMRRSLPEGAMTDKLLRLDRVLERLFETLRKYPDQLDELERFMEYYLPTTVKLVTAYRDFSEVEFPGENLTNAKREIEETMDTINGAFEKLLDDMYEDTAFDVMTDASVLQSILKREGLTESDFEMKEKDEKEGSGE